MKPINDLDWYHDKTGKPSSMRIISMICAVTGCAGVIFGGVLIMLGYPDGAQLSTVSAGMAGLGEVAKAWQSGKES
jgi:hypothetical protein